MAAAIKSISWPAFIVVALQTLSTILLTLILICPAPFQQNSIALLTVQPQKINSSTNANLVNVTNTNFTNPTTTAASVRPTSTVIAGLTDAPTHLSSDANVSSQVAAAVASSGLNKRLALPISNSSLTSSNASTISSSDSTTTNSSVTTAVSDIQLRLGPLGTCFRTSTGVRSCSPAKLNGAFEYGGLQVAIDQAGGANTIDVASLLPSQRNFFAVLLVIMVSVCAGMATINAIHLVVLTKQTCADSAFDMRGSETKGGEGSTTRILNSLPWLSLASFSQWTAVCSAVLIFVSAGVQKYTINNAVNAFNNASPVALAPAGYKGNSSESSQTITLVADTASGFGFAWTAAIALIVSFWIQRTFLRRQRALADAQKELHLRRSASTLSRHSPPAYHSRGRLESQDQMIATLPSLRKAHEGNARLDESKDVTAPFATYQSPDSPVYKSVRTVKRPSADDDVEAAAAERAHCYPPPASSRFMVAAARRQERDSIEQLSQCMCSAGSSHHRHRGDAYVIQAADQKPASVRSVSPAPSYWTGEWRAGAMHATGEIDRERERHFMAELRRKRSAGLDC